MHWCGKKVSPPAELWIVGSYIDTPICGLSRFSGTFKRVLAVLASGARGCMMLSLALSTSRRRRGLIVRLLLLTGCRKREAATAGNGTMIAFTFDSRSQVDSFDNKAIDLGGTDDGAPGDRGGGSYFAYFRDLNGNKLCGWTFAPA